MKKNTTKAYTVEQRTLYVEGHTWEGFEASYEYPLKGGEVIKGYADAKAKAGDFSDLTLARIVTTRTVTTEETQSVRLG